MGLPLYFAEYGSGSPLVILHGMLGSSINWRGIAKRLSHACRVFAVDLRNHGQSPWHDSMSYAEMAEDVADFIQRRNLTGVSVLGHSMGGKTAMMLALEHGNLVERLMVVDIAPVDYPSDHLDYVEAMQAIDLNAIKNRVDADAAMRGHVPQIDTRLFLLRNLVRRDGHFDWNVNLSALALNMQGLAGFPNIAPGHHFARETYFIHGTLSHYVRSAHMEVILDLFPKAILIPIPNAAHWVHFDQPEPFIEAVRTCLGANPQ